MKNIIMMVLLSFFVNICHAFEFFNHTAYEMAHNVEARKIVYKVYWFNFSDEINQKIVPCDITKYPNLSPQEQLSFTLKGKDGSFICVVERYRTNQE